MAMQVNGNSGFPWLSPLTFGSFPSSPSLERSSVPSAWSAFGSSKKILRLPFSSLPTQYSPVGFFPDFSLLMYSSCGSDSLPELFPSAALSASFAFSALRTACFSFTLSKDGCRYGKIYPCVRAYPGRFLYDGNRKQLPWERRIQKRVISIHFLGSAKRHKGILWDLHCHKYVPPST